MAASLEGEHDAFRHRAAVVEIPRPCTCVQASARPIKELRGQSSTFSGLIIKAQGPGGVTGVKSLAGLMRHNIVAVLTSHTLVPIRQHRHSVASTANDHQQSRHPMQVQQLGYDQAEQRILNSVPDVIHRSTIRYAYFYYCSL